MRILVERTTADYKLAERHRVVPSFHIIQGRPWTSHTVLKNFYYCLADPIHNWFINIDPDYSRTIKLVWVNDVTPVGFYLDIPDGNLAMMFKLAWGGVEAPNLG